MGTFLFHGIIPPVVTLFDENGEIDWQANRHLADWLIEQGVHGLLFMGSTGEFSSLTLEERKRFVREMVAYVNGRVPVLVGTGSTSLKDALHLSQHVEEAGANGVLVVNPFYWKFTDDQLFQFYATIAGNLSIPVILYNIPLLTGQSLSVDLVFRLATRCQNIVGIKDTIENIGHIREILLAVQPVRPDFAVFSAFDEHILPCLQIGAAGAINGTAVFAPHLSVQLYEAFRRGDLARALELHRSLVRLMAIYRCSTPLFLAIKEAVHQLVLPYRTGMRPPCGKIDETLMESVRTILQENGLFRDSLTETE